MPAPATVAEFLDLVRKSGVVEEARLKAYLAALAEKKATPAEPGKMAGTLVRDGLLTYFQAEQLLQGKYKRFSIGKYKVLERLGSGGMGQVFLCEHKLMRRRVAVKVLPTAKATDEASLGRFYREARAIAAVDHPNLVRAYDIDQDDNLHFLVMEYVDGTNLQDLIKKFGPLDVVRACHYVYASAVGLQHAHEIGLVHRDIKPGNVLLDRSGVVKILDLGLARFFHDSEDNITKQYDENILGTADYLSPEQAEDSHTVDIRSDIYSLGATFYFLLSGSQPFPEGTIPQKLIWHRTRDPRPVRSLRPEVPEAVAAVLAKMMAKKPEDRYQLPSDVMAALAPWVATAIPPPPEREMPQLSPALVAGMAGAGRGPSTGTGRSVSSGIPVVGGSSGGGHPITPGNYSAATAVGTGSSADAPAGVGVWESLAETDTTPAEEKAGRTRPHTTKPKSDRLRTEEPAPEGEGKRRLLPFIVAGTGLLLLGGVAAGYFLFFNKPPTGPTVGTQQGPVTRRLVVSKAGGDNTFATLRDALQKAGPGDTIEIKDSPLAEPPLRIDRRAKGLTIESGLPDGKPAVIELTSAAAAPALFDLSGAEDVTVRNLELDGKGGAEAGVAVTGSAAGVRFDHVTVRNVKVAGFRLLNVAGDRDRPVTLDRVRVLVGKANDAGVKVEAQGTLETKHVTVRNSRFEGPGKAGVRIDGAAVGVELTGNRLFKFETAFLFGRVLEGRPFKVQVTRNTVSDATLAGIQFGPPPKDGEPGKVEVPVSRNYFVKTKWLGRHAGGTVVGVTGEANGRDAESQEGNVPLKSKQVDGFLPPADPNDDETFLRFKAGRGPTLGDGVQIGAE